jgi:hypothetical protein
VLYNDNEIVAIWKPYGLPMFLTHSQAQVRPVLVLSFIYHTSYHVSNYGTVIVTHNILGDDLQ